MINFNNNYITVKGTEIKKALFLDLMFSIHSKMVQFFAFIYNFFLLEKKKSTYIYI